MITINLKRYMTGMRSKDTATFTKNNMTTENSK